MNPSPGASGASALYVLHRRWECLADLEKEIKVELFVNLSHTFIFFAVYIDSVVLLEPSFIL